MHTRPKRDTLVKSYCKDREADVIRAAARAEQITISEFVRLASVAAAKRVLVREAST